MAIWRECGGYIRMTGGYIDISEYGGYLKDLEVIYEVWRLYLEYEGYLQQG